MKHLLTLSLGPVQEFIAAARRTSDLTAGSKLLEEIAKATSKAVEEQGGKLIFPADSSDDGPNKILAELPEGIEPSAVPAVAEAAKVAARAALKAKWTVAKEKIKREDYDLNEALADSQVECFLEIYATWTAYETDADYSKARTKADGLLAARKNLRNFSSLVQEVAPKSIYAKSPLDPAFECVLKSIPESDTRLLKLRGTEFLDAISLLKRVEGREMGKVPSTRDMARRHSIPGFLKGDWSDEDDLSENYGYFAILVADGDKMGAMLNGMTSADKHQEFSRKLAAFGDQAGDIVKGHDGYLVYAGGDDVMAFLPAKSAVECARDLAAAFDSALKPFRDTWKQQAEPEERDIPIGTLSAGVAIVHYREPLSLSLEAARTAEKTAKDEGRDSLALALHTRGGTPLTVTQKWEQWSSFEGWLKAFMDETLTRGVAYELRALADEFKGVEIEMPDHLLNLEAQRVWERKEGKGDRPPLPPGVAATPATLGAFADLLVAARFLTQKGENEDGKNAG